MLLVLGKLPKGTELTPEQFLGLLNVLYPVVDRGRTQAISLANEFYQSQRLEHHEGDFTPPDPVTYALDYFVTGVRNHHEGTKTGEELNRAIVTTATNHVEDAANRTLLHSVEQDDKAEAWQRLHISSKPACSFCQLMIGRGAVYKTEKTAAFSAHDHDKCIVVPVFVGQDDWEGKAIADQYRREYKRVTRGLSGKEALNEYRRFVRDKNNS